MIVVAGCTGDLSKKKIFPAINKVFRRALGRCMGGEYAARELDQEDGTLSSSTSAHNLSKYSPITHANPVDVLEKKRYLEATESRIFSNKLPQSDILKNNNIYIPRIIGYARSSLTLKEFIHRIDPNVSYLKETVERIEYYSGEYDQMVENIYKIANDADMSQKRVYFYLAVPPETYPGILKSIQEKIKSGKFRNMPLPTVLIEKPIGVSLDTFNELKACMSDDSDVFLCVDHYLFKNVLVKYRGIFNESILKKLIQPGWIEGVKGYFNETIGVEGRESYYNTSGACRDVLQNHLLLAVATVLAGNNTRLSILQEIESLSKEKVVFGVYSEYYNVITQAHEIPKEVRATHSETSLDRVVKDLKTSKLSSAEKGQPTNADVKETFIRTETMIKGPWDIPLKMTAGKKMPSHFVAVILMMSPSAILFIAKQETSSKDYENPELLEIIIKSLEKSKECAVGTESSETEDSRTPSPKETYSISTDESVDVSEESADDTEKPKRINPSSLITGKIKIKITPKESISIEIKYKKKLAKKINIAIPNSEDRIDAYEHLFTQLIFESQRSGFSPLSEIQEQWRIVNPILDHPEIARISY
ncbi:glucose-6-phosphate 1-dehydrogenase [Nematocida ausubeli]|nr:glucose-6-phosphate 1-dehydrogenase [Nematocida ausubeli]KAI5147504.1 glucose-6-phosphate 1-dehydrogenase [Nematocida ausubeli]